MNRKKTDALSRENLPFYLAALLLLFLGKYLYSKAGCDDLRWILRPTAGWVRLLSGIPFEYVKGSGYVNHDLKILIAASCSGVQFMLISAVTFIFSYLRKAQEWSLFLSRRRPAAPSCNAAENIAGQRRVSNRIEHFCHIKRGICWIFFSILLSYLCTILVNSLRIIAAIYLPLTFDRLNLWGAWLTPQRLHTAIGVVVYFTALLSLHQLVGRLFSEPSPDSTEAALLHAPIKTCAVFSPESTEAASGKSRQTARPMRLAPFWRSPVFWYFFVVLGIPALNNVLVKNSAPFGEFALLVTLCCGTVLLSRLIRKSVSTIFSP